MDYIQEILADVIFGEETDLKPLDLTFKGMFNASGGSFPTPVTHGDYYGIDKAGSLPAPVGNVYAGDWLFYSATNGWQKGSAVKVGVSKVNDKTGFVVLVTNDISDSGQTNKWFTQAERDKLAGIEAGAEVNDTSSEIKAKYESNPNTNAYTDAEKTKLFNLPSNADVNVIETVKLNGVKLFCQ